MGFTYSQNCMYYFIDIIVSLGIAPTWNCTHFLKIEFMIAGGGFYSYYIRTDKERKIVRKKLGFMRTKRFNTFLKTWVQFRVGVIPRLPV